MEEYRESALLFLVLYFFSRVGIFSALNNLLMNAIVDIQRGWS